MIPKIIHYIWFGHRPLPPKVRKCIESWRHYLPDYTVILWNEDNFPIDKSCLFVREAYEKKHYAFVADYVRFHALERFGGVYLDTDVEFIKSIDNRILDNRLVLVLDNEGDISGSTIMAEKGNQYIADCLAHYESIPFVNTDGSLNNEVINVHMQDKLRPYGYRNENFMQSVSYKGQTCTLYTDDYFHVRSLLTGRLNLTENSCAIHWHTILWASRKTKVINFLRLNILTKIFGIKNYSRLTKLIKNGKTTF